MSGHTHDGYGSFPGGDPRNFSPDYECSTEEERAAHKAACVAWAEAERKGLPAPDSPSAHSWYGTHEAYVHVTMSGFGLGVYSIPCDDPACEEGTVDLGVPVRFWITSMARWDSAIRECFAGDDEDTTDVEDPHDPH